jgi:hypothetical protein
LWLVAEIVAVMLPVNYSAVVLGLVLGCLSIYAEVPDKGALVHETAAQMVDSFSD